MSVAKWVDEMAEEKAAKLDGELVVMTAVWKVVMRVVESAVLMVELRVVDLVVM